MTSDAPRPASGWPLIVLGAIWLLTSGGCTISAMGQWGSLDVAFMQAFGPFVAGWWLVCFVLGLTQLLGRRNAGKAVVFVGLAWIALVLILDLSFKATVVPWRGGEASLKLLIFVLNLVPGAAAVVWGSKLWREHSREAPLA